MKTQQIIKLVVACVAILLLLMFGMPVYWVWSAGMTGKAQFRKATYNRQVRVLEAKAEAEAASWHQQRDTVQAHGIARANAIIGNSLKDNQPYLVFKWLETLREIKGNGQVIYLPGLSPLPVTEATRLQQQPISSPTPKAQP
jgi:hypothetical protein